MSQRLDENQGRSDFFSSIKTLAFGFLAERFEGLTTGLGAHLIRPPGALDELSFLSSCTRCDKCIEACPQDALIKADAKTGLAIGSPHIDPRRTPCFLCTELTKHIAMAAPWAGESRKFLACFSMSLSLLIMLLSGLVANKTLRAS